MASGEVLRRCRAPHIELVANPCRLAAGQASDYYDRMTVPWVQLEIDALQDLCTEVTRDEVVEGLAPPIARPSDARVVNLDAYDHPIICYSNDERAAISIKKGR